MSDRDPVSAAVPDPPSEGGSVAAPEAARRRDTSGLAGPSRTRNGPGTASGSL